MINAVTQLACSAWMFDHVTAAACMTSISSVLACHACMVWLCHILHVSCIMWQSSILNDDFVPHPQCIMSPLVTMFSSVVTVPKFPLSVGFSRF